MSVDSGDCHVMRWSTVSAANEGSFDMDDNDIEGKADGMPLCGSQKGGVRQIHHHNSDVFV